MNAKVLVLGTLAGALTLFGWETISNTALPWHQATLEQFSDSNETIAAIRASAPKNGVYVDMRGVFAAVAFTPDMADRQTLVGRMLAQQIILDLALALVLVVALQRFPRVSTGQYGLGFAIAALAVGGSIFVSDFIWYGFSTSFMIVNWVERIIGYGLMGLAIGGSINKWSPRVTTDEWGGVKAAGGYPSTSSAATAPRV